jgi:hypothetical protein
LGTLLLVLSVCAFVARSEVIVFSALTALPLLGLWLYFLWPHVASSRARPSVAPPGRPRQVTWAVVGLGITLAVQAASLVPTFAQDGMAPLEVFAVLQCLALSVCAVQTWRGANWARWSLIALVVASWLLFAQASLEALRRLSVDTAITVTMLLLDLAILGLLLTRPASLWLRGRHVHTGHGS